MRFWDGKNLAGHMIESTGKGINTHEDCMDLCLSKSECVSFNNLHSSGICSLYGDPIEDYFSDSESFSAGVRCNSSFEPTPAYGIYPAVLSTPGET